MFPRFSVEFSADIFNLLLARFQAETIIVEHLIQGRNNEIRLGVEPLTLRSWSSKNGAPNHCATLLTKKMFKKANRLQDPKKSRPTTPPGSTFGTRFVLHNLFKIDFR